MKKGFLFKVFAATIFMYVGSNAYGQGMAVNTSGDPAHASAILDATSTTQGMLVPRMTESQRGAISGPATGLLVYQTNGTTPGFWYNSGVPAAPVWVSLNALSNVTTQGNTFNGTGQLVQTNGSGQLPVLSGANLTDLPAGNLTGTLPALNGSALTSLSAANLTGTLPALNGAALTSLSGGNITNSTVTVGKISATGTASATTFLNGSGAWSQPLTLTTTGSSGAATFTAGVLNIPTPAGGGGGGALQFFGTITSAQSVTGTVNTKIIFDNPSVNLSTQMNTTNGRFTVAATGYYLVTLFYAGTYVSTPATVANLYVNGTFAYMGPNTVQTIFRPNKSYGTLSQIIYLNANDYIETYYYSNQDVIVQPAGGEYATRLAIYKL